MRNQAELVIDKSVYALTRGSLVLGEARVGFASPHPSAVARITVAPVTP